MTKPQIINPPNRLKSKVSMGGPGAVDQERLARAEAVIEQMTDNYLDWVEADLKKLEQELSSLTPGEGAAERVDLIYRTSHDIKGQGGSFGYNLMTEVGALLCRYIENIEGPVTQEDIDLMNLCYQSMRAVITGRLAGDGGDAGRMVLDGLARVAEKVKAAS
ncbi:MAG: Hpt domain-containing protein [Rhodospirillales bacterium]